MTIPLNTIKEYLKGKKIILFTVTKDMVNFIRLYNRHSPEFTIAGIVDLTLTYRPSIRKIIEKEAGELPICTTLKEFQELAENADMVIKFDHAIGDQRLLDEIEEYSSEKFCPEEFEEKLKARYEKYIEVEKGKEFTFITPPKYQSVLNSYIVYMLNIKIVQCYGDLLLITQDKGSALSEEEQRKIAESKVLKFEHSPLDFTANDYSINIYQLMRKETPKIKPIFVLSSDFAGGKTRYILSRNERFLSGDLFTAFFDLDSYYGDGEVASPEPLTVQLHQALARLEHFQGHEKPVYIKIEGCLNSFLFDFEQGTSMRTGWSFFHRYFADYEFHIVIKESEDMGQLKERLQLFCSVHQVDPQKVKVIRSVNHCESFEEIEA